MQTDSMNREGKFSTIVNKYPTHRDEYVKGCWKWLKGRRADDNAEGLWRVNDKLYDLTSFIDRHPGGREWLVLSKGTDITEAFEVFHLDSKPAQVLKKFYVREATEPRNYLLTFEENGFFKTLRRRLIARLKAIDVDAYAWKSKLIFDIFVFFWIACGMASMVFDNWAIRVLFAGCSGVFATFLANAGHNFIHQKNSWRMYGCHAVLVNFREFRVLHAMSHHVYPNSVYDLETLIYEPFLKYMPTAKTRLRIFLNYLSIPLIYLFSMHGAFSYRVLGFLQSDHKNDMQIFYFDDIIGFCMPPLMLLTKLAYVSLFATQTLTYLNVLIFAIEAFLMGNLVLVAASLTFNIIGLNVGHHGTDVTHEGDEFRSLDFGAYTLAVTIDRIGANANLFMALTHYGEHILHHMIPSVDHSVLHLFWDILEKTCEEFKMDLRLITMKEAALLQFGQLKRTEVIRLENVDENFNVKVIK